MKWAPHSFCFHLVCVEACDFFLLLSQPFGSYFFPFIFLFFLNLYEDQDGILHWLEDTHRDTPGVNTKKDRGCRESVCSRAVIIQVLLPCIPRAPYNTGPTDWERSRLAKIFIFVCVCVYIDMTIICIYERVQLNSTESLWVFKALQFHLPNTGKKVLGFCLCFCIGFWLR